MKLDAHVQEDQILSVLSRYSLNAYDRTDGFRALFIRGGNLVNHNSACVDTLLREGVDKAPAYQENPGSSR